AAVSTESIRSRPIRSARSRGAGALREPDTERGSASPWQDELFHRLAVSAPVGLVVVDTDGRVRLRNDDAVRILGDVDRLPAALRAVIEREEIGAAGGEQRDGAAASEPVVLVHGL